MNQPMIDVTHIHPPLPAPGTITLNTVWNEHGLRFMILGTLLWKMIKAFSRFLDEWERERKGRKGKTVIEFCKDKCWNTSPYWMQLAGGPRIIIMMKNRKQTKQRVSKNLHLLCYDITVSNPACQHCIYSIKTPLASAAWHAVCLHTPYKYYMQCT